MLVDPKQIITHLQKIYCGGQIKESRFSGPFQTAAITTDQSLLVISEDGTDHAKPLPQEVGVIDLNLLIKSLSLFGEDEESTVNFDVEDHRIVLSAEHQGTVRLVTGEQISTTIAPETLSSVMEVFQDAKPVPIPQNVVEGCLNTIALLKADQVSMRVDPSGVTVKVGSEKSNFAEYNFKGTRTQKKADAYELIMDAGIVKDVFSQISDYTQADITFTGADGLVRVECGEYSYIISPQEPAE